MPRTYTAKDLIQLPRLSGREALVLVIELQTALAAVEKSAKADKKAGKHTPLPTALQRSMARLTEQARTLESVLAPQRENDTQEKRKADRVIDNAWAAFASWLGGFCLLPVEVNPHVNEMIALRDMIFATGLSFTQLPFKVQWGESKARLEAIARDGHEQLVQKVGGGLFLSHLKDAQAAYGKALRITQTQDAPADEEVRSKILATLDAIRDYANRAANIADPDEPGSDEIAEALLRPLMTWQGRALGTGTEEAPEGEAPAQPAAPVTTPENPK